MAVVIGNSAKNAMLNALRDLIDAGAGAGTIKVYTAPKPSNGAAITSQTLLAELAFSDPCAPNAAGGVLTFDPITGDASANASGVATWARIADSAGNFVADLDVSDNAGAGELKLTTTTITIGGTVNVTSGTVSFV